MRPVHRDPNLRMTWFDWVMVVVAMVCAVIGMVLEVSRWLA